MKSRERRWDPPRASCAPASDSGIPGARTASQARRVGLPGRVALLRAPTSDIDTAACRR
jgi:hypothetical protein